MRTDLACCAAFGLGVDALVGEPPDRVHPVAVFGDAMNRLEPLVYRDHRGAGAVHTAAGLTLAIGTGAIIERLVGPRVATVAAVAAASAGRMLGREALAVADLLDGGPSAPDGAADLDGARRRVAGLVGRDTSRLGESELARATIESVAENTVDAAIATLWWGAVGGARLAMAHRAVNTLDAMVGHRTARLRRFGWASARLDDAAAWIPARLTVVSLMLARPASAGTIWRTVRRDAAAHPSPNGGAVEAAFAAALGVTLGGTNHYAGTTEHRGRLGDGPRPDAHHIRAAVRAATHTTMVAAASVVALAGTGRTIMRRVRRSTT